MSPAVTTWISILSKLQILGDGWCSELRRILRPSSGFGNPQATDLPILTWVFHPLYPSVTEVSSKWAHQVTFAHQNCPAESCTLMHLLQPIKEKKKPNCFLSKTLREMISHLQDGDNEEEIRTLFGPAVTDWAAGWIGGNSLSLLSRRADFSAMSGFWNSACLLSSLP